MGSDENSKDKQSDINIHTIRLIHENIQLYHDNIKLINELQKLRKRLKELEEQNRVLLWKPLIKEGQDYMVILVVKKGREN